MIFPLCLFLRFFLKFLKSHFSQHFIPLNWKNNDEKGNNIKWIYTNSKFCLNGKRKDREKYVENILIETAFQVYRRFNKHFQEPSNKSDQKKLSCIQAKSCIRPFKVFTTKQRVIWYFWAWGRNRWNSIHTQVIDRLYNIWIGFFFIGTKQDADDYVQWSREKESFSNLVNCFRWFVIFHFEIKNPSRNSFFRCEIIPCGVSINFIWSPKVTRTQAFASLYALPLNERRRKRIRLSCWIDTTINSTSSSTQSIL